MEIESVSLMNMNTTASLPRYFTFNGVSFEKEEKPSLSDRKHPSSFKHDLTAGKVMQSSTNNSQKSNLEGFARMPTISQIKRESNIDSDLVKQEAADYHEPDQKINHSQNEVENSQLFIKKEIFEEDLSEENGSKSQHDSEEESEKDQAHIKINMKQAKIDRTEAFNEIEMIRHSELNNIYTIKLLGEKILHLKQL